MKSNFHIHRSFIVLVRSVECFEDDAKLFGAKSDTLVILKVIDQGEFDFLEGKFKRDVRDVLAGFFVSNHGAD